MNRSRRIRIWPFAFFGLALASAIGVAAWNHSHTYPKRFASVVEGRIYRSGSVSAAQLERLQREHGIRRVISLLDAKAPETLAERDAARELRIDWHNIPLRGNGASTSADRERLRELLSEDGAGPTLVHCAAGTNRTGLAIGMFRLHHQGWSLQEVMEEMGRFGFENEPHHRNLREALAAEAALAAAKTSPQGRQEKGP